MNTKKIVVGIVLALAAMPALSAFAPVNFFRPEDRTLRLPFAPKTGIKFGLAAEYGSRATGLNWDGKRKNVLQMYDDTQAAVWMVKDRKGDVATNQALQAVYNLTAAGPFAGVGNLNLPATYIAPNPLEDGTRGRQVVTGKFNEFDMTLMAGVKVLKTHGRLALNLYAPVKCVRVADVNVVDQTVTDPLGLAFGVVQKNNFVHDRITANLKQNVMTWGELDLSDWRKAGWGDLLVQLDWSNRYTMEMKHLLKAMTVGLRAGVSCPTGVKKDVDKVFSMALGNDDAWAFPLGATMELDLWTKIKLGCNIDWLGIHDKSRIRRLKTDTHQTEFLLLNKGMATKHYGITWNLEPYVQLFHLYKGWSLRAAYQYITHDKDELTVNGDSGFDNGIINTARSLQPWRVHNMIFNVNYDLPLAKGIYNFQCGAFYKMPFKGRGIIDAHTVGGQFAVNW